MLSSDTSNRKDLGWKYATLPDPSNTNDVKCNFCGKLTKGGITRHKQHLVGGFRNTKACPKCPDNVKEEIKNLMVSKKGSNNQLNAMHHFNLVAEEQEDWEDEVSSHGKRISSGSSSAWSVAPKLLIKKPKKMGPMDLYFTQDIDEVEKQREGNNVKIHEVMKKKREHAVENIARWMYDAGITFNSVNYDSFAEMIEAFGQCGSRTKPPTYYEVSVTGLKKELEHTDSTLTSHKEDEIKFGCSLIVDGWSKKKNKALINFLVNSPRGSRFVESVDVSAYSHTGEKLFELLDKFVQRVGEKNIVQVITNSESANVLAGQLLEAKYPNLYWSPCAAYCIDLIFEDIFKISDLKKTYERAIMIDDYIYDRTQLQNMLKEFTGERDLIKRGKTHFATVFLTLQKCLVQKTNLKKLFSSEMWAQCKYSKEVKGKIVANVILMQSFWNHIVCILKIAKPLVKLFRLVNGEKKHPMGYIYKAMDEVKETIMASFSKNEEKYKSIFEIVDKRWLIQLHRPLHAAGCFLNPQLFYANPNIEQDAKIMTGLYDCIERIIPSTELQDKIVDELLLYRKAEGMFGMSLAIRQRTLKTPAEWWSSFGCSTPNLQRFAIKVLSLSCSASDPTKKWSVFKYLHFKKRNRLEQRRLNDLVYIKYNRALRRQHDSICLENINECNEWALGTLDDSSDEENALVLDGDLTWDDIPKNTGVEENVSSKPIAHGQLFDEEEENNFNDIDEEESDCCKYEEHEEDDVYEGENKYEFVDLDD